MCYNLKIVYYNAISSNISLKLNFFLKKVIKINQISNLQVMNVKEIKYITINYEYIWHKYMDF